MEPNDLKQLLGLLVSPQVTYQLTGSALVQFHALLVKLQTTANPPPAAKPKRVRKRVNPRPGAILEA